MKAENIFIDFIPIFMNGKNLSPNPAAPATKQYFQDLMAISSYIPENVSVK